jgi:hypothetical protein
VKRKRAEGRALVSVAADELGRQVLRLRRATAVPRRQDPASADEDVCEATAPAVDPGYFVLKSAKRLGERSQVRMTCQEGAAHASSCAMRSRGSARAA